MTNKYITLIKK